MSALPPTHSHPTPLQTLAPHLTPHLPHSLPLLRRLQHHHSSPHAHTLATFPPTSTPPSSYSALWIDRSRGPETECWLFSTYELPSSPHSPKNASLAHAEIIALFNAVAQLPVPPNRPSGADYIVVGSLRESLVNLLGGDDLKYITPQSVLSTNLADRPNNAAKDGKGNADEKEGMGGILGGLSTPYMKWIIAPPPPPPKEQENEESDKELELPPGYYYDRVRADRGEYKLVLSRTDIPRSEATLSQLGSVGIRYLSPTSAERKTEGEEEEGKGREETLETGPLISWAFLGVDGSLTSLHVEPSHRGKGLAKAVARRLFRNLEVDRGEMGFADVEGEEDGAWAHSDVAVENLGSAGVARALGGREGWGVRWCHVDLGRVRGAVGGGTCGRVGEGGGGVRGRWGL